MRPRLIRWLAAATVVVALPAVAVAQASSWHGGAADASSRAVTARHCSGVVWRSVRNNDQLCPTSHSLLSDRAFAHLHWSSWGGQTARAVGDYVCSGGGCPGTLARVSIKLSSPLACSGGVKIYSRISVVSRGGQAPEFSSAAWSYHCHPRDAPSGLGGGGG